MKLKNVRCYVGILGSIYDTNWILARNDHAYAFEFIHILVLPG